MKKILRNTHFRTDTCSIFELNELNVSFSANEIIDHIVVPPVECSIVSQLLVTKCKCTPGHRVLNEIKLTIFCF